MAANHLPQAEAQYLQSLHTTNDMPALRSRTRALREAGWTLRAIGEPLGAPRSTVRSWENHPDAEKPHSTILDNQPPLPTPPGIRPAPFISSSSSNSHAHTAAYAKVRALPLDVPEHDQQRIAQLAPLARRVRGGTPPSSPYRQAKQELNDLLAYYADRRVPVQRLAELAGVTYRAMKVRLDEHSGATHVASRPAAV
jgi:hypothetical protein